MQSEPLNFFSGNYIDYPRPYLFPASLGGVSTLRCWLRLDLRELIRIQLCRLVLVRHLPIVVLSFLNRLGKLLTLKERGGGSKIRATRRYC